MVPTRPRGRWVTTPSARKGAKGELEIARILADHLGVRVRRKLGAGRADDEGDIEGLTNTTVEVKNYPKTGVATAINEGLRDLRREQANAASTFGVCFVKRPRLGWIAVMDVDQFCAIWREATS
jgi:hypothetical protein